MTALAVWSLTRPAPPRVVRLTVTPSGATALGIGDDRSLAISPDGTRLAYVGAGAQQIFVRALDQLQPTALQGLGAPSGLFFSPDGQWIGFFDGASALKKVAATGGPPVTVSRTTGRPRGASWSTDDTIVFAHQRPRLRFVAGGGRRGRTGGVDDAQPGPGRAGSLVARGLAGRPGRALHHYDRLEVLDNAQIAVLDLTTREQKILIRGGSHARYVPTGHLVYGVAGTLRAVAFDLRRLEVVGTPVPVLEQVMTTHGWGRQHEHLWRWHAGLCAGRGAGGCARTLVWVDRQGREEPLKAPPRAYLYPRLSPDGTRVALDVRDQEQDIWIWDLARETLTRFTFDPAARYASGLDAGRAAGAVPFRAKRPVQSLLAGRGRHGGGGAPHREPEQSIAQRVLP